MTGAVDAAHWGEAAFYLGLELAEPLLAVLIEPAHLGAQTREATRKAILSNREAQEQDGRPIDLSAAILSGLDAARRASVGDFVEERLITYARPRAEGRDPLLAIHESERLNGRLGEALLKAEGEDENLRLALDAHADAAAYDSFLDALFACDAAIAGGRLSSFDRELLRRNAEATGGLDPFRNLVFTFDRQEKTGAVARYGAGIGAEALDYRRAEARRLAEG